MAGAPIACMIRTWALGLVVAAFVACVGATASSPDAGTGSDAGGGGEGGSGDGGLVSGCPATAPTAGAACTSVGVECEYGNDLNVDCETIARCDASGWTITPPASAPTCPTPAPGASCPASYSAVPQQSTCSTAATCAYPQGTCSCEVYCGPQYPVGHACEAGTPMTWECTGAVQGCPATRPRVGTACSTAGQACDYGDCNTIGVVCQSGTWHTQMNGCPVSTRRDKKDVRYLGDDELHALAEQTLATRLATYQYTIGEPGQRLGFVIEDQPSSPAVVQGKDRVDLYGYASMTVATLLVQARQLEELRREVEALRRECGKH